MNPYSFLNPVTDPTMFYGYRAELEYIVSKVTALQHTSIFVIGGCSMGKTSLLRQVEQRLRIMEQEQHIENDYRQQLVFPLYLDMLQLGDATLNDFFAKVGRLLNRCLTNATAFTIPDETRALLQSLRTDPEPLDTFMDVLAIIAKIVLPLRLRVIFLIDDLWRVKYLEANYPFGRVLRALHAEPSLDRIVAYVITGSYHEFDSVHKSPLENTLLHKELHVFDEEQALALINEPTKGQIPVEVAQQVYLEAGGHPFLIQSIMYELCENEQLNRLTVEDVNHAILYFTRERRDFEHWWNKLEIADVKIYGVFCRLGCASVDELHRMMLSIPAEGGRNQIINRPMILDSLSILRTMGLLRKQQQWDDDATHELAGQWHARWFSTMNNISQSLS